MQDTMTPPHQHIGPLSTNIAALHRDLSDRAEAIIAAERVIETLRSERSKEIEEITASSNDEIRRLNEAVLAAESRVSSLEAQLREQSSKHAHQAAEAEAAWLARWHGAQTEIADSARQGAQHARQLIEVQAREHMAEKALERMRREQAALQVDCDRLRSTLAASAHVEAMLRAELLDISGRLRNAWAEADARRRDHTQEVAALRTQHSAAVDAARAAFDQALSDVERQMLAEQQRMRAEMAARDEAMAMHNDARERQRSAQLESAVTVEVAAVRAKMAEENKVAMAEHERALRTAFMREQSELEAHYKALLRDSEDALRRTLNDALLDAVRQAEAPLRDQLAKKDAQLLSETARVMREQQEALRVRERELTRRALEAEDTARTAEARVVELTEQLQAADRARAEALAALKVAREESDCLRVTLREREADAVEARRAAEAAAEREQVAQQKYTSTLSMLRELMEVKRQSPYIGIEISEGVMNLETKMRNAYEGCKVLSVKGPAERAGVKENDIIRRITHTTVVKDLYDFKAGVEALRPSDQITLHLLRGTKEVQIDVVAEARSTDEWIPGTTYSQRVTLDQRTGSAAITPTLRKAADAASAARQHETMRAVYHAIQAGVANPAIPSDGPPRLRTSGTDIT